MRELTKAVMRGVIGAACGIAVVHLAGPDFAWLGSAVVGLVIIGWYALELAQ